MLTLTKSEVQALDVILQEAIVKSSDDDGDPVFHDVAVASVNPFGDRRIQSDVYGNLAKSEFILCSGTEDEHGNEVLTFVCITPKGLEALKAATGVH